MATEFGDLYFMFLPPPPPPKFLPPPTEVSGSATGTTVGYNSSDVKPSILRIFHLRMFALTWTPFDQIEHHWVMSLVARYLKPKVPNITLNQNLKRW